MHIARYEVRRCAQYSSALFPMRRQQTDCSHSSVGRWREEVGALLSMGRTLARWSLPSSSWLTGRDGFQFFQLQAGGTCWGRVHVHGLEIDELEQNYVVMQMPTATSASRRPSSKWRAHGSRTEPHPAMSSW